MSYDASDITTLSNRITEIGRNSVGTTGFGAAVGVLSVCVLTAIILGSVSLNESNSSATQNINKITANFVTNDDDTGVVVTQGGDGKYQVSLVYTNTGPDNYIQYLNGVTPGTGGANQALVLNEDKEIVSGVSIFFADIFIGQLGGPMIENQNPAYISGLSVTNGSYLDGILVSGDTNTNSVTGTNSAVVGGVSNQAYANMSFVAGGFNNSVSGASSAIIGGYNNSVSGVTSGNVAGQGNSIFDNSTHSFIGGGQTNTIHDSSNFCGIIGGSNNGISGSTSRSFIAAGLHNGISGSSDYSMIGAGQDNNIKDHASRSFIGGGQTNTIHDSSSFCGIIGGQSNVISDNSTHSFIGGGWTNGVCSNYSGAVAGQGNSISDNSTHSFIGGGKTNGVCGNYSGTVGGQSNVILDNSTHSFIGGGYVNEVNGNYSGAVAGQQNNIYSNSSYSFIGGGNGVGVCGNYSGAVAGQQNNISDNSTHSFIGGGNGVDVSGNYSGTVGGVNNYILSNNTVILGGEGLSTAPGGSWDYATLCGKYNDPNFYPWDMSTPKVLQGVSYRFAVGSGTGIGTSQLAFAVDNVGNLYFGTAAGASIYQRIGQNAYTAKAFTIQHPTINNRWLRHGCLEGPEGGVYYRGKGEAPTTIQLPDYATHIASDFTVQVTPIGSPRMMSASEVSPEGTFRVYGEGKFHWNAIGERVALDPEPLKTDVTIHSVGPYSWSV